METRGKQGGAADKSGLWARGPQESSRRSEHEVLGLPHEHVEKLILLGEPLIFRAGSAELLGSFKIASDHLVVDLAQIEGGGEGVLVSLASLAKRNAMLRKLFGGGWISHHLTCAKP